MSKLVIKRSQWLHGEGARNSYLRRPSDGKMCCLGILGSSLGATEDQLSGQSSPSSLASACPWTNGLLDGVWDATDLCAELMRVNDDRTMNETSREKELTELFSQIDIEVEFVD